jgi:hypothetical protein
MVRRDSNGLLTGVHQKIPIAVHERTKRLSHWIEDRLGYVPDEKETSATHHIQRICATLYPPMTMEEVQAEFAGIIGPLLRKRLEQ